MHVMLHTMRRVTITVDPEHLPVIEREARRTGLSLSAYVARAAYDRARGAALSRWVASDRGQALDADPAWRQIEADSEAGDDEARRPGAAR
jgi:hypothetical protein